MKLSRVFVSLAALAFASLACEPVFVIGRGELAIVILVALVLLGPPLVRFWSRWEAFKRHEAERKKK